MITISGEGVWAHGDAPADQLRAPSLYATGVGLGRIPRWGGQTRDWYPLLAHSIVVAALLPPELRVYGLLHDAAEIMFGDCMATWKLDADREREEIILGRFHHTLGLEPLDELQRALVKRADMDARYAEAWELGFANGDPVLLDRYFPMPDEDSIEFAAVQRARGLTARQLGWADAYRDPATAGCRFASAVGVWSAVARGELPAEHAPREV